MIFYHRTPFHFNPQTSIVWAPNTQTSCSQRRCGNKKQKISDVEQLADTGSKIIYQDRNSRIHQIDNNQIEFLFDLPGTKVSDTQVEIHDGVLKVTAERKHGSDRTTKFGRQFLIKGFANQDSNNINACLEDGVLRVTVPKKKVEKAIKEGTKSFIAVSAEYPHETSESDINKHIIFSSDLPGVSLSDVTLELHDGKISLQATRKVFDNFSTTKRNFAFDTGKVDATTFTAYLVDGVLSIIGLKKELPEPKQIVVKDGSAIEGSTTIEDIAASKDDDDDMVVVETVADETKQN